MNSRQQSRYGKISTDTRGRIRFAKCPVCATEFRVDRGRNALVAAATVRGLVMKHIRAEHEARGEQ
jgi:hypothetical protein